MIKIMEKSEWTLLTDLYFRTAQSKNPVSLGTSLNLMTHLTRKQIHSV